MIDHKSTQRIASAALGLGVASGLALVCGGCTSLPDVNLTTDEPIKVDINVRLDVYQHQAGEGGKPARETEEEIERQTLEAVNTRKRNRMAEVQRLKDNRIVGENHRGLLTIRKLPLDSYGDYVKQTVEAENEDRNYLMRARAKSTGKLLHEIQEESWQSNVDRSFQGEWLELAGEKEGSFVWKQKE